MEQRRGDMASSYIPRNQHAWLIFERRAQEIGVSTTGLNETTSRGLAECITTWLRWHKHAARYEAGVIRVTINEVDYHIVTSAHAPLPNNLCEFRVFRTLKSFLDFYQNILNS